MAAEQWYAVIDNQRQGPMSPEDLEARIDAKQITAQTLLWREGMANWVPAWQCLDGIEPPPVIRLAQLYDPLPWYRKNGVCSALLIIGLLVFRPLVFIPVISCLTGPVYYRKLDENGNLATWSWWNKVAAVILLLLAVAFMVFMIALFVHIAAEGNAK